MRPIATLLVCSVQASDTFVVRRLEEPGVVDELVGLAAA